MVCVVVTFGEEEVRNQKERLIRLLNRQKYDAFSFSRVIKDLERNRKLLLGVSKLLSIFEELEISELSSFYPEVGKISNLLESLQRRIEEDNQGYKNFLEECKILFSQRELPLPNQEFYLLD